MNFSDLGLIEPIARAVNAKGYDTPTPIQLKAIPAVLAGKHVMATAQTGTGKTAGFVLPILQRLVQAGGKPGNRRTRVLVLTPTRELAAQIHESVVAYGQHLSISSLVVFGGVKVPPQVRKLGPGVDVLVATPGRLLDLQNQKALFLDSVETLVLDEADRMLDMGFIHDIRRIHKLLPAGLQTLMFSATFSPEIRDLAKTLMPEQPVEIDVAVKNSTADTVNHHIITTDKSQKVKLLAHLITSRDLTQVLVFSRTKHGANRLVKELYKHGIPAVAIHGNKSQAARTRALADFKQGRASILVATDIAARGIDIVELPMVINFDLPSVPEDYVHRIGRTGRAGQQGQALSLVSADEAKQLHGIERLLKRPLEREEVEDFEAEHRLPESRDHSVTPLQGGNRNKPGKSWSSSQSSRSGSRGRRPAEGRSTGNHRPSGNRPSGRRTARQG